MATRFKRARAKREFPASPKFHVWDSADHGQSFGWFIDASNVGPAATARAKKKYAHYWQGASSSDHFQLGDIPTEREAGNIHNDLARDAFRVKPRARSNGAMDWDDWNELVGAKPARSKPAKGSRPAKPKPAAAPARSTTQDQINADGKRWMEFIPKTGHVVVEGSSFGSLDWAMKVTMEKVTGLNPADPYVWVTTTYEQSKKKPWRATDDDAFKTRAEALKYLKERARPYSIYRVNGQYLYAEGGPLAQSNPRRR